MGIPKGGEWIVILIVVLLLFGARKLPDLARSLGASTKEFRKGIEEGAKSDDAKSDDAPADSATTESKTES